MHHPTVVINGERWNVVSANQNGVTVLRDGRTKFVAHEDVR